MFNDKICSNNEPMTIKEKMIIRTCCQIRFTMSGFF